MAKRNKYSRWRRLPAGLSRTSRRQFPDDRDEPRPLTLSLPGSFIDAAEEQARRAGAATVQEYCAGLLRRVLDEQRVREQIAEVETRRGALEGLQEIANDPEYLAEWNAQAARHDRDEPPPPPPELPRPEIDFEAESPTPGPPTGGRSPRAAGVRPRSAVRSPSRRGPTSDPGRPMSRRRRSTASRSEPETVARLNGLAPAQAPTAFSASAESSCATPAGSTRRGRRS